MFVGRHNSVYEGYFYYSFFFVCVFFTVDYDQHGEGEEMEYACLTKHRRASQETCYTRLSQKLSVRSDHTHKDSLVVEPVVIPNNYYQ